MKQKNQVGTDSAYTAGFMSYCQALNKSTPANLEGGGGESDSRSERYVALDSSNPRHVTALKTRRCVLADILSAPNGT